MPTYTKEEKRMNNVPDHVLDAILVSLIADAALEADKEANAPKASPLDLLSKSDYAKIDRYLDSNFGPFREYIDENYVALLFAIADYEEVDFYERIKAHIVANIAANTED